MPVTHHAMCSRSLALTTAKPRVKTPAIAARDQSTLQSSPCRQSAMALDNRHTTEKLAQPWRSKYEGDGAKSPARRATKQATRLVARAHGSPSALTVAVGMVAGCIRGFSGLLNKRSVSMHEDRADCAITSRASWDAAAEVLLFLQREEYACRPGRLQAEHFDRCDHRWPLWRLRLIAVSDRHADTSHSQGI